MIRAGIGPEIVCRCLGEKRLYEACNPVVIGSQEAIRQALQILDLDMEIRTITDPADGVYNTHTVNLIHCDLGFSFSTWRPLRRQWPRSHSIHAAGL